MLLLDKYKPKKSDKIIGQYYNIKSLRIWLNDWNLNSKNKCVILHGPSGTGKTIAANLLPKENGFYIVEYNPSDVRTKGFLEKEITENQDNKSIQSFFLKKKKLIIMEEIDSISDKGGISELLNISKKTKCPIIFICNEITKELKSLKNVCLNLKFFKPKLETIIPWLKPILQKERIKISNISEFITNSNYDFRQILIRLDMKCNINETMDLSNDNIFETTKKLLNNDNSINENLNMYFSDYFMSPLMVQENYTDNQNLDNISKMSDYLSYYDILDSQNNWSLLPLMGFISVHSVNMIRKKKKPIKQVKFTKYLGNMSKQNKNEKIFSRDIRLDVLEFVKIKLTYPLIKDTNEGIIQIVDYMKRNKIDKDTREQILELSLIEVNIPTKIKSALTRMINKTLK
jgi:replication factor C subunit 1